MLGPENAVWDDGEWVGWDHINSELARLELRQRFPHADLALVSYFQELLDLAERFHRHTGRHLDVYGELGELFAAITFGIALHRPYAQGSDGRLGDDFVEVKTITPFKSKASVTVDLKGHFSKLVIVRIDDDFEVSARLLDRADLRRRSGRRVRIDWHHLEELDGGLGMPAA
jgi:hypothetical protein